MTVAELIRRKFRRRWSDLQLLVLLELGKNPATFIQLVDATCGSTSGVWSSIEMLRREDLCIAETRGGRTVYMLTGYGQNALAEILG